MLDTIALVITHGALVVLGLRLLLWGDPEDGGSTEYAPDRAAKDRQPHTAVTAAPEGAAKRAAAARLRHRRFSRHAVMDRGAN